MGVKCFDQRRAGRVCPVVGVMSGTSLDGIDICLATMSGAGLAHLTLHQIIDFVTVPIDPHLRCDIQTLMKPPSREIERGSGSDVNISQLMCRVNMEWSRFVGEQINELLARNAAKVDASLVIIASHGQTIWHEVGDSTLQIGDGETLCQVTQKPVVSNFRCADVAVGGQGAPLVPYFDLVLASIVSRFSSAAPHEVAFQNLGGIGNVCVVLPEHGKERGDGILPQVCAFDTGPANVVLNELIEQVSAAVGPHLWRRFLDEHVQPPPMPSAPMPSNLECDWNGVFSSKGTVVADLLEEWLRLHDDYIQAKPPKSTGRERFGHQFVKSHVVPHVLTVTGDTTVSINPQRFFNVCRTVVCLTAETLALSYRMFLPCWPRVVALSGGGALNPVMRVEIERALSRHSSNASCVVTTTSSLMAATSFESNGFNFDDAKEALAFAVLGHERLNYFSGVTAVGTNVVSATGASLCVSLGAVSLPTAVSSALQ